MKIMKIAFCDKCVNLRQSGFGPDPRGTQLNICELKHKLISQYNKYLIEIPGWCPSPDAEVNNEI